jgi:hypothetical protein
MIGTGDDPPSSAIAREGALEYSQKAQALYQQMNRTGAGGG